MPTHQQFLDRRYFSELDGLRALCVLIVVTTHMHDRIWDWLAGGLGVTVFFVLSGFLITTLALREEDRRGRLCLSAFFVRRCFRIFPLYYLVLALYCVLILWLGIGAEKRDALLASMGYLLFYLQEIPYFLGTDSGSSTLPFYQSWSLGIEEKFYLVWPILAFVVWRGRDRARIAGVIGLAIGCALLPLAGQFGWCFYSYYPILVGCLIALWLHRPRSFERVQRFGQHGDRCALVFVAVHFAVPYAPVLEFVYPLAAGLLLIGLVTGSGQVGPWLAAKPLVRIGGLSYGIYLVHILALNAAEKVFPPGGDALWVSVAALLLAIAISLVVAFLLFRFVEKPCIEVGRRLSRRLAERAVARREPVAAATPVGVASDPSYLP